MQPPINSSRCDQFMMSALLGNTRFVDHDDAIEWLVGITLNLLEPYATQSREHRLGILKRYALFPLVKSPTA